MNRIALFSNATIKSGIESYELSGKRNKHKPVSHMHFTSRYSYDLGESLLSSDTFLLSLFCWLDVELILCNCFNNHRTPCKTFTCEHALTFFIEWVSLMKSL